MPIAAKRKSVAEKGNKSDVSETYEGRNLVTERMKRLFAAIAPVSWRHQHLPKQMGASDRRQRLVRRGDPVPYADSQSHIDKPQP